MHLRGDKRGGALNVDLLAPLAAAVDDFHFALGEFFADRNSIGNADEVGILEFDAGPIIAIIEERVKIHFETALVNRFGGRSKGRVGDGYRRDDNIERGDGGRECQAVGVMMMFCRGTEDSI